MSHKKYILQVLQTLRKKFGKKFRATQMTLLNNLAEQFFSHSHMKDLRGVSIQYWTYIIIYFKNILLQKKSREFFLSIYNPSVARHGWQSKHTIIQIISYDMPFLEESIHQELNRLRCKTYAMLHAGNIVLTQKSDQIEPRLALTYIEIEKQADFKILNDIKENLYRVLREVNYVTQDWDAMRDRIQDSKYGIKHFKTISDTESEIEESVDFLQWLLDDHFTFLGILDYEFVNQRGRVVLKPIAKSALGVLRHEAKSDQYSTVAELSAKTAKQLFKEESLFISKTSATSSVHRAVYTDDIGIKRFNATGQLIGERRVIGLFTSLAYAVIPDQIPLVRKKIDKSLMRTGFSKNSSSYKSFKNILINFPRDDLFQASENELYAIAAGIYNLQESPAVKLFVRIDPFRHYVSCFVYMPRDNFSSNLITGIQNILEKNFQGKETSLTIHFSELLLTHIHYVIHRDPNKKISVDIGVIEQQVKKIAKTWRDRIYENMLATFGVEQSVHLLKRYANAFPAGYRDTFASQDTIYDIINLEKAVQYQTLGINFYRPPQVSQNFVKLKLYSVDFTIPLSTALPILENMGMQVLDEQTYLIVLEDDKKAWVSDFSLNFVKTYNFNFEVIKGIMREIFHKVWLGEVENDNFNKLGLEAQLSWRKISVLRAYAKYMRQIGITFSPQYIAETLISNSRISCLLVKLFECCFDPAYKMNRDNAINKITSDIYKKLNKVTILDEDRILRGILHCIQGTIRTNYYQLNENNQNKSNISFKFDSKKIPELPLPHPKFEIFVYSPRYEGVHLRMDKVARGGIRWSDRREDFRTEILGLMKAQQVKNALIVPAGAKGGFIIKTILVNSDREQILQEGISCYQGFINGLLDLTDNFVNNEIIPPANTVCRDDADYYLVVAADKGTATFSDIANQISIEREFWLADAFASGGSSGYDHKKMGITARGAWLSVKRAFQDLRINVDETEITVLGIGDMSGDVLGNGLLLSKKIKLVAAFNHQHIFLDPNPDSKTSYKERQRLFNLSRSTWENYNPKLISKGGGVYSRTIKSIPISAEVKQLLHIKDNELVPNELIKAMMKAPLDLLWNGGIGTFVKATNENHAEVGDRTNDEIRVNGNELGVRVVAEGGNLGFTQLARIEYELKGGKINTDFIDNSAGVDCSDHEVNIKIFLNELIKVGKLTLKQRNQLLKKMTNEVADLVLKNNYNENLTISLSAYQTHHYILLFLRYLNSLEEKKKINRKLEFLPDTKTILERKHAGIGLTRPELAIILAYSQNLLDAKIRRSGLTTEPYFSNYVKKAFPVIMRKRYDTQLKKHRLAKEIISNQITNQLFSEMGISFIYRMSEETRASTAPVVRAYAVMREVFNLPQYYQDIKTLDYKIGTELQYQLLHEAIRLIRRTSRWLLFHRKEKIDVLSSIQYFSKPIDIITANLIKLIGPREKRALDEYRNRLISLKVSPDIALKFSKISTLYHTLNIVDLSKDLNKKITDVARIYFILIDRLDLNWIREKVDELPFDTHWSSLARSVFKFDLDRIQRDLVISVCSTSRGKKNVIDLTASWFSNRKEPIKHWNKLVTDLHQVEKIDFTLLTVVLRELSNLIKE